MNCKRMAQYSVQGFSWRLLWLSEIALSRSDVTEANYDRYKPSVAN